MSSFPMAPLFRQSVGFDRFNDLFEHLFHRVFALVIVEAQCVALVGRQPGSGGADTTTGTCDQHDSGHGVTSRQQAHFLCLEICRTVPI